MKGVPSMNEQARQINDTLSATHPSVYESLSALGKAIYFPKVGILNQSAEAKKRAHTYNATIGIATEEGVPMHLGVLQQPLSAYDPVDLYPYAPPEGKPALRQAWRTKLLADNPTLQHVSFGQPIVTHALTHGLSIAADLFVEAEDAVIMPDKNWENYELIFGVRRGASLVTFPLYDEHGRFHAHALKEAILAQQPRGKAIVLLNFPNNPTGYTPTEAEAQAIIVALEAGAKAGITLIVLMDDAYFGLFYEDCIQESLFGRLIGIHPRILPIKIDGATKEEFVWGFRVGFITYGSDNPTVNDILEQKTLGIIRSVISSASHPSQTFILQALQHPQFAQQRAEKVALLRMRAERVKALLTSGAYEDAWSFYPFNSGYFMCLKLRHVHAETLRQTLLAQHGIGTIALGDTDLRIAFSCIEMVDLAPLFDRIYACAKSLMPQ
jgi:aspartate/methionine/tyrosine aminotransferase